MVGNKYLYNNSGVVAEKAAIQSSAGAGDAGKIPALDSSGKLDPSFVHPAFAWASRPGSATTGDIIRVTDVGAAGGSLWIWDGSRWAPTTGVLQLARSNTVVALTGTLVATTLATISIPGGLMSANSSIRITSLWTNNTGSATKTMRINFGGTTLLGLNNTTNTMESHLAMIHNDNSVSAQKAFTNTNSIGLGASTGSLATSAIDTASNFDITFVGVISNVAAVLQLESYHIELLY